MHTQLVAILPCETGLEPEALEMALERALAPCDCWLELPRGRRYVTDERLAELAARTRLLGAPLADPSDDLAAAGWFSGVRFRRDRQGRPYYVGQDNPQGRWDSWEIGGRFGGFFIPREGAGPSFAVATGADDDDLDEGCDALRVRDLDWPRMAERRERTGSALTTGSLALGPYLLSDGEWLEVVCPWEIWTHRPAFTRDEWDRLWRERLDAAGADAILVNVDFHW